MEQYLARYAWVITALAINPVTPTTLYAGTRDGLVKSTDGGGNWSAASVTNAVPVILAINPATPTTLYAGTAGDGVVKSTDGGEHWARCQHWLDQCLQVNTLTIDPVTPTTLYVGLAVDYGLGGKGWRRFQEHGQRR